MSPIGKIAGASLESVTAVSTLSLADAVANSSTSTASVAAIPAADVATKLASAGAIRTGAAWSVTVTIAVAVPVLPAASDAEKTTVVVSRGKTSGASLVTDTEPSTLSFAVAACKNAAIAPPLAGVPAASIAAKVAEADAVTTGGTVSVGGVSPPEPPPQAVRKQVAAIIR